MPLDFDQLRDKNPEWTNLLLFNGTPAILFQTVEATAAQLTEYISLFNDYGTTLAKGATLSDTPFHVHRFYDGLIYGRADPATKKTDGFCLYRTPRGGKTPLYAFVTYDLPDVSARIIPLLAQQLEEVKGEVD
jgi:hypothetical protein